MSPCTGAEAGPFLQEPGGYALGLLPLSVCSLEREAVVPHEWLRGMEGGRQNRVLSSRRVLGLAPGRQDVCSALSLKLMNQAWSFTVQPLLHS